jgi:hypothetical protein
MKSPLKMQERMGNAWVLVSRNVSGLSKSWEKVTSPKEL